MAKRSLHLRPIAAVIIALCVVIIALPQSWKQWAPGFLRNPALHLGLDLVGGTQLDFRISEEEINKDLANLDDQIAAAQKAGSTTNDQLVRLQNQRQNIQTQQANIVEAIRTVLERRINALGVSEAIITPSFVGNEKHLLVECPGVIDTQECIRVVGKTIQLEFKEEFTQATADYIREIEAKATQSMRRVTESGTTLQALGQDLSGQLGVSYSDHQTLFKDELPKGLEDIWNLKPGVIVRKQGTVSVPVQQKDGSTKNEDVAGIFLVQTLGPRTSTGRVINEAAAAFAYLAKTESGITAATHTRTVLTDALNNPVSAKLKTMQPGALESVSMADGSAKLLFLSEKLLGTQQVGVSHILVSYKGASAAPSKVTRTKAEALARAKDLKKQLDAGADFATLARANSDGPSASAGGSLGVVERGAEPPSFEDVAFSAAVGKISEPVETQFGYHIIRVDAAPSTRPDFASYNELTIKGADASKRAGALIIKLKGGLVRSNEEAIPVRTVFFSLKPTGWKDTGLDGTHFRTAAVSVDPVTNIPVVQIQFDDEGAKMFQELTKKNISKRIAIFVGGQLVSAPTVQQEIVGGTAVITGSGNFDEARNLAQDLNTGAIPAPIYLVGQYTIEATLGAAALQTSLLAALIGTIILMLYMLVVYRLLGAIADIALAIYAVIFFALLKMPILLVTNEYIVLTLAGMAGIILSIGIAVDANVLVFERMKEELRRGKVLKNAVETSFKYAWPAIRDSNISAIITCLILFLIGTSIVRGFALTLGMGVVLSLFTAVVISRWLLRKVATLPIADRTELFAAKRPEPQVTQL